MLQVTAKKISNDSKFISERKWWAPKLRECNFRFLLEALQADWDDVKRLLFCCLFKRISVVLSRQSGEKKPFRSWKYEDTKKKQKNEWIFFIPCEKLYRRISPAVLFLPFSFAVAIFFPSIQFATAQRKAFLTFSAEIMANYIKKYGEIGSFISIILKVEKCVCKKMKWNEKKKSKAAKSSYKRIAAKSSRILFWFSF